MARFRCENAPMSIDAVSGPVEDLLTQVSKVIEVIRPAIQADDGDIELHGVDEETGEVTVEPVSYTHLTLPTILLV